MSMRAKKLKNALLCEMGLLLLGLSSTECCDIVCKADRTICARRDGGRLLKFVSICAATKAEAGAGIHDSINEKS